jgi:hypothetical protein
MPSLLGKDEKELSVDDELRLASLPGKADFLYT